MIYFDNAASSKIDKDVLDVFYNESINNFANSSANHLLGQNLNNNINRFKKEILESFKLNSANYDVIFTSGATEANNLAIFGSIKKYKNRGNHIITSNIEHPSVLNCFKKLESDGFNVTYLSINNDGLINLNELKNAITKDTFLISLMGVNNEVGNILNLKEVQEIIKNYPKIILHSDLAQAVGKVSFDYTLFDMFTISSYKIYGLKGSGALIKKKKIQLEPILCGGNQQDGLRSGTLDYPSISAFTYAIIKARKNELINYKKVKEVYDYLKEELLKIEGIKVHLVKNPSPYIINFSLLDKKASVVIEDLSNKGIYLSTKSSCSEKIKASSHVIYALTNSDIEALNSIRLSLGKDNTIEEAKKFIEELKDTLSKIKG